MLRSTDWLATTLLEIDWSNGDPIPPGGINYLGGTGDDSLSLLGGVVTDVEYTFLSAASGTITVDGGLISYDELEPIIDNLNVVNRVFTFTAPVPAATLTKVSATLTRIDSGIFESVDFTTPSGSLTINLAAGSNELSILSLADDFNTPVNTIVGNSGDDWVYMEVTRGSAGGPTTWNFRRWETTRYFCPF